MPAVKFVVKHETVFGYQVFMHIQGWQTHPQMMCVRSSSPITWETTLQLPNYPTLHYKYFFRHPNDPEQIRFFEDGCDREFVVCGEWAEQVDCWRQNSSCVVTVKLFDQMGKKVTQPNQPCDTMQANIYFFPPHKNYVNHVEQIPLEVHVQRKVSGNSVQNDLVWEHMVFRMIRNSTLARYELHAMPLLVNDDFWNVGKIMVCEINAILHDQDGNGGFTGSPRGTTHRYQFFNRHENWVGVRSFNGGDDRFSGRGTFSTPTNNNRLLVTQRPKMWVNFSRREGCRHTILHLLHTAQHSVHASVYNLNDPEVANALIAAKRRGIDVQILTSSKFLLRDWQFNREYKRLVKEGVLVIPVVHDNPDPSLRAVTNHTKFAVFDRFKIVTGSCNWEQRAFDSNSENIVCIENESVAQVYECMFETIRGRPPISFPHNHADSLIKVYYSRTWRRSITKVICRYFDSAIHRIDIAMFIIRPLVEWEDGHKWDVFESLFRAKSRGVTIWTLLEGNTHEGGKYKDRILPADNDHFALGKAGINCLKFRPMHNNDPCSALHHKFVVIDSHTTITGSFNLWGPSLVSDDDLIVIHDQGIAREHQLEMKRMLDWYVPSEAHRFAREIGA